MSEEIIKVLDDLGNRFGIAIDWSSQNILPYLQDLMQRTIKFKNAEAIIWIIFSIIILIVSFLLIYKSIKSMIKHSKEIDYYNIIEDDIGNFTIILTFGFLALTFLIVLMANIFGIVQNIYTPELTIIKYILNINTNC